jgi:TPR repeat protein
MGETMVAQHKSNDLSRRKRSLKRSLLLALIIGVTSPAFAQTPLRKAPVDTSNPCVGVESADGLASCGMVAFNNHNYPVARSAWSSAAGRGHHLAAIWLAGSYADGDGGEKDNVQAYKWYDIAAAIHGAEIDKLPPGTKEDNQQEINYREGVARKLTPDQITDAQKLAHEWLARHAAKRNR